MGNLFTSYESPTISQEIKDKFKDHKIYNIRSNRGVIFKVFRKDNKLSIVRYNLEKNQYDKIIKKIQFEKIFVGESSGMTKISGHNRESSKLFKGNTLLLLVKNKTYVYIGEEIVEFKIKDTITNYYSPLGNGDIPDPKAIGTQNVYFFQNFKTGRITPRFVRKKYFEKKMTPLDWEGINSIDDEITSNQQILNYNII